MTGKYPIHNGMQRDVIIASCPWGLGLNETILPQYLKSAGYNTHLIGKWHLGFYERAYNPIQRGFDSFFGYYFGFIDYYNYTSETLYDLNWKSGYDMRDNEETFYNANNTYATDLFTNRALDIIERHNSNEPLFLMVSHAAPHAGNKIALQAPDEEINKFSHIKDNNTRVLTGKFLNFNLIIKKCNNSNIVLYCILKNHSPPTL